MTEILTLDNGLRIVLEPIENAKTCSLGVWIASGSAYETPETAGTSHFIEHMLFRGTLSGTFRILLSSRFAMNPFSQCLSSTYYVSGTVLDTLK